jgi:hypothetical protein
MSSIFVVWGEKTSLMVSWCFFRVLSWAMCVCVGVSVWVYSFNIFSTASFFTRLLGGWAAQTCSRAWVSVCMCVCGTTCVAIPL